MASSALRILLLLGAAGASASLIRQDVRARDSVIQKVVEMLEDNKVKIAKDLASEEKEMAEYSEFCDDESTAKNYAIKESARKIDDLGATIEDAEAQIKAAEDTVVVLGSEMAEKEKDLAASEATRKAEKADFQSTEKTLVKSVDQLEKAIMMVKKEEKAAFLQKNGKPAGKQAFAKALEQMLGSIIDAAWVGAESTKALKGFIQQEQTAAVTTEEGEGEDLSLKAAAAAKRRTKQEPAEKKSGGVVETLEDMKTKAEETLSNTRLEEMKAEHNYQMVKQTITDALTAAKKKTSETQELKSTLTEEAGEAKGQLSEAKKTQVADKIYLKNLLQECASAADEWTERQKDAKAEMEAIDKAKSILAEKVKVLVQRGPADYYDPSDSDGAELAPIRAKLVKHLKDLSHRFSSYALAEMASAAASDPFEKVRGIVGDMIAKLVAEANEEASQKSFCDEEMAKSTKEKEDKSMRVDELQARVDAASTGKATLLENIKSLQAEISEMDKASAEATKLRNEEHATYLKASKDFKDAADAVTEAIHVLKEYYQGSLVQVAAGSRAAARRAPSGAGATIISILETSGEEFTRMLMETEADEKEAADNFKRTEEENAVSRAAKEAEIKGSESEVKSLEVALEEGKEDNKMATKELDAVLEYIEKLKPQCETKAMSYEEKKAKREEEIEGLKEALSILDAPALVQTHRH